MVGGGREGGCPSFSLLLAERERVGCEHHHVETGGDQALQPCDDAVHVTGLWAGAQTGAGDKGQQRLRSSAGGECNMACVNVN